VARRGAAWTSAAPTSWLAPGATVMMFSPARSTEIMASPVGASAVTRTPSWPTPSSRRAASRRRPKSSSPTQPTMRTLGTEPGRRDRLVGPLPTGREPGRRAEHGRAGFGQPGHGDGDIHVQAAQHGDPRTVSHARTLALRVGAPAEPGNRAGKLARNLALSLRCAAFYTRRVPRQFRQVDVFTDTPYFGNPVAVVLGADGLSDEQMQVFARWTNLSETTFVLAPRAGGADYRGPDLHPGAGTTVRRASHAGHLPRLAGGRRPPGRPGRHRAGMRGRPDSRCAGPTRGWRSPRRRECAAGRSR